MSRRALLGLAVALSLAACSTGRTPAQVHTLLDAQERASRRHAAVGEVELARSLWRGVLAVDPARPADDSPGWSEVLALPDAPLLGVNRALREPLDPGLGARLLLWLPDRLLDLVDLVSFDVGIGLGAGAELWLTRFGQLGAGAGASMGLGWHGQRSLGARLHHGSGWAAGPWTQGFVHGFDAGTGLRRAGGASFDGSAVTAALPIHQEWRDAWGLGARAHLAIVAAEVELHPLQLADFAAGLVGQDLLGDDLATTTSPGELLPQDELPMVALREVLADERTVVAYRAWIAERRAAASPTSDPP